MVLQPPPPEQIVTSSDLVRHFGLWQERAARGPIYILHRGRPRFVLTSVATMDALCAPYAPIGARAAPLDSDPIDAAALLDGVSDLVLLADADCAIRSASRAARAHFGGVSAPGGPVEAIAPEAARAFFVETIRRVMASGIGERLELPSAVREGRMLLLAIKPAGSGVAIFARDGTTARDHARARAAESALGAAMIAATHVAGATINPRGYITEPTPALAAITGLSREALGMIRFLALFEIDTRATLGAAIETAMAGDTPVALDAHLLVNRANPLPVRIGVAPLYGDGASTQVAAIIVGR